MEKAISYQVVETGRAAVATGAPLDGTEDLAFAEDTAYGIAKIQAFRANKRRYLIVADNGRRISIVSEDGVV